MSRPNPMGHHKGGPKPLLTDDQVREARIMHERNGKTVQQVADHFGLDFIYARNLLAYRTRSRVYID